MRSEKTFRSDQRHDLCWNCLLDYIIFLYARRSRITISDLTINCMNITTFLRSHRTKLGVFFWVLLFSSILFSIEVWAEPCSFSAGRVSIVEDVDNCLAGWWDLGYTKNLVNTDWASASLSWDGRERIKHFVDRLIAFGMGWLVIGGGYMASSVGNDQKVKKGKDAVKWSVIGMIVLIFSYPLMNAVINFVYQLGG